MNETAALSRNQTVTAFFRTKPEADRAVDDLVSAGFSRNEINLVPGETTTMASKSYEEMGFWKSLRELFLPEEDRTVYAEGLRRGGYMVAVKVDPGEYDRALDILDRDGSVDLGQEETSWRSQGWEGHSAQSTFAGTAPLAADYDKEEVIPVAEEELHVGKRDVSHGRVRVRSYVVETPVEEDVSLHEEQVDIERRPVNRTLQAGETGFEEKTIEMEERAEEPVVSKEARVKEEVRLKKKATDRTEKVSDTVRRTEVDVDDPRSTDRKGQGPNR